VSAEPTTLLENIMTLNELLEIKTIKYSMEPHNVKGRFGSYSFCTGCGLVYFRNELTKMAQNLGCNYDLHPSFKRRNIK